MISWKTLPPGLRAAAVLAVLAALSGAADAATPLYLAFGVESTTGSSLKDQIIISDLHEDHYHPFDINNGEEDTHVPAPMTVMPVGEGGTLTLGSMNISPFPVANYVLPPGDTAVFELRLTGLAGPDGTALVVNFMESGTPSAFIPGTARGLTLTDLAEIRFSLPHGAPAGEYEARFQLADTSGAYHVDTLGVAGLPVGSPQRAFDSNFTILVNAVPEPSSMVLVAIGAACLTGRRRRLLSPATPAAAVDGSSWGHPGGRGRQTFISFEGHRRGWLRSPFAPRMHIAASSTTKTGFVSKEGLAPLLEAPEACGTPLVIYPKCFAPSSRSCRSPPPSFSRPPRGRKLPLRSRRRGRFSTSGRRTDR